MRITNGKDIFSLTKYSIYGPVYVYKIQQQKNKQSETASSMDSMGVNDVPVCL
jgi:hypothetical protein